jgi:hypothetical protein
MFNILKKLFLGLLFVSCLIAWKVPTQAAPNIFGTGNNGKNLTEQIAGGSGYNTAVSATTLSEIVGRIIQVVLSIIGVIFFVLVVYAGYLWMTSRGDESQVEKAQNIIKMAVIGLVITLSAYTVSFFVVRMIGGATGGNNQVGGTTPPGQGGTTGNPGTGGTTGGPTCSDGVKNYFETDVDCGGTGCAACGSNKSCQADSDCQSGDCFEGVCIRKAPEGTCDDGLKNGEETDTDCGGLFCPQCGITRRCKVASDCVSRVCSPEGQCVTGIPGCSNNVKDGVETDIDCGGDGNSCSRCDVGDVCIKNSDCNSGKCTSGSCRS